MFPGFALLLALPSHHHGRGAGVVDIDEGVTDLALAREQIWSVVIGAKLGRRSRFDLYRHQGGPSTVS